MSKSNIGHTSELNYDAYKTAKYDREIVKVVPGYAKLHHLLARILLNQLPQIRRVLDLGCGTGITSALIRYLYPHAHLTVVDFSAQMLAGARTRLGAANTTYMLGDYSTTLLPSDQDLIVSCVGMHHLTDNGNKEMFARVFQTLQPGGMFALGDLMTWESKPRRTFAAVMHYRHMVRSFGKDLEGLLEWTHHHRFKNNLRPVEEQVTWLCEVGFVDVVVQFVRFNTTLITARRPNVVER